MELLMTDSEMMTPSIWVFSCVFMHNSSSNSNYDTMHHNHILTAAAETATTIQCITIIPQQQQQQRSSPIVPIYHSQSTKKNPTPSSESYEILFFIFKSFLPFLNTCIDFEMRQKKIENWKEKKSRYFKQDSRIIQVASHRRHWQPKELL